MAYKNIKIKRLNEAAGSYQGRNPDGSFIRPNVAFSKNYNPHRGLAGQLPAKTKLNSLIRDTAETICQDLNLDTADLENEAEEILVKYLREFGRTVANRFTRRDFEF